MSGVLGIYYHSPRAAQAVESAIAWATLRGVETIVKTEFGLSEFNQSNVDAVYVPIYWGSALSILDKSIPLIIDIDVDGHQSYADLAKDRIIATRTFSRYQNHISHERIRYQVPYIHLPLAASQSPKNVVLIDIHNWEEHMISYFSKKLAFAKSLDPSLVSYCNLTNSHSIDSLPYLKDFVDFRRLVLDKMRLLISTHSWLSDMDVFNAYIAGVPLLCLNKVDHYHHPMERAMLYLEPALVPEFDNLRRYRIDWTQLQTLPALRSDIPVELFVNAYVLTWDLLWEWVSSGFVDTTLMYLTINK